MTSTVDLFTYLPGLQVSPNEVLESTLYCQQTLEALFPDTDWRSGTGASDLVIRPTATLLALVNKALVFYFSQNTVSGITDQSTSSYVDALMSNWFATRNLGSQSIISARLFFAIQKNITISSSVFFSPDNVLLFFPPSNLAYTASQLTLDAATQTWYIDIELQGQTAGPQYNISSGNLLYFSNFDPYFLNAQVNFLVQVANSPETNTQFISRVGDTISTRNLINVPSINSNLLAAFPLISGVTPLGLGDPEMIRDMVQVTPTGVSSPMWTHTGGMVDIYCRVPLSIYTMQFTTDAFGNVVLPGAMYQCTRSSISGGSSPDTLLIATGSINTGSSSLTVSSSTGFTVNQNINIVGAGNGGQDLNAEILSILGNALTISTPASTTVSNTAVGPAYTLTNPNTITYTGVSATASGGVAVATSPNHCFAVGRMVTISGDLYNVFNGSWEITAVTRDTFTFNISNQGSVTEGSVLTATGVLPIGDVGFSVRQTLTAGFGAAYANQTVSFNQSVFEGLNGIQTYLGQSANRVLSADLLARGFNIYILDFSIVGYNGPAPSSATALTIITGYLQSLVPGQLIVMGDLLAQLSAGGISSIRTPIDVTYTRYTRDLTPPTMGTIVDTLNPEDPTSIFVVGTINTTSTSA